MIDMEDIGHWILYFALSYILILSMLTLTIIAFKAIFK